MNSFFTQIENINITTWPSVKVCRCDYQLQAYHDNLFGKNNIVFPDQLVRAVPKRRAEYLAGRFMAVKALESLGISDTEIATGPDRSPLWPTGIIGSITHTSNCAYAAVANVSEIDYIGLDYEHIIASTTVAQISPSIINNTETDYLKNHDLEFETAFTIAFSAKESLFKALYPSVKRYFDFSAAHITALSIDGQFTLDLTENLSTQYPQGKCIDGYFVIEKQHVLTMIIKSAY